MTEARCKRVEFHTSSPEPLLHCSGLQIIMAASCFVHFFIINYLHFVLQAKFGMPKVWQDGSIFWRRQPWLRSRRHPQVFLCSEINQCLLPLSDKTHWEFYILEKSTMNAIQEAFSRFFMLIIGYISFPF